MHPKLENLVGDGLTVKVTIVNRLGLHARPAMAFVDTASKYASSVRVRKGKEEVDGKSIMEIMMLAATKGTELEIVLEGEDAGPCAEELTSLVARGFDEE
ncbi:MAG: HPr family phosphocarrier protein [Phycisphaerales bacterium JB059]